MEPLIVRQDEQEEYYTKEKCFIRKSGMKYHIDLHAIVHSDISVKKGHDIAHNLKDYLRDEIPNIESVLIHIEPDERNWAFAIYDKILF